MSNTAPKPSAPPTARTMGYIVLLQRNNNQAQAAHDDAYCMGALYGETPHTVFTDAIHGFAVANLSDSDAQQMRLQDSVLCVEPDFEMKKAAQNVPWSIKRICVDLTTAPDVSDVHIFVLDTGVKIGNPDINLVESLSFMPEEPDVDDHDGHGTQVASCAAARNNTVGVVGAAPGAAVHSYKVINSNGGRSSYVIAAIDAVVRFKRTTPKSRIIVNLSLGAVVNKTYYYAVDRAIQSAVLDHGITVVVAAGNERIDASLVTPAHVREAITVGSFGRPDMFSVFSNHGPLVDILAPGESILHIEPDESRYGWISGTSFSAPYVAGAAAVYLAQNPNALPGQVLAALQARSLEVGQTANPRIKNVPDGTTNLALYSVSSTPKKVALIGRYGVAPWGARFPLHRWSDANMWWIWAAGDGYFKSSATGVDIGHASAGPVLLFRRYVNTTGAAFQASVVIAVFRFHHNQKYRVGACGF